MALTMGRSSAGGSASGHSAGLGKPPQGQVRLPIVPAGGRAASRHAAPPREVLHGSRQRKWSSDSRPTSRASAGSDVAGWWRTTAKSGSNDVASSAGTKICEAVFFSAVPAAAAGGAGTAPSGGERLAEPGGCWGGRDRGSGRITFADDEGGRCPSATGSDMALGERGARLPAAANAASCDRGWQDEERGSQGSERSLGARDGDDDGTWMTAFVQQVLDKVPEPLTSPRSWVPPWALGSSTPARSAAAAVAAAADAVAAATAPPLMHRMPSMRSTTSCCASPSSPRRRQRRLWKAKDMTLVTEVLSRIFPATREPKSPSAKKEISANFLQVASRAMTIRSVVGKLRGKEVLDASPASPERLADMPVDPASAAARVSTKDHAEVVAFKTTLAKSFGNLPRAFRAMTSAAGQRGRQQSDSMSLVQADFEWCVVSFLKYGDRRLAARLWSSLDTDRSGKVDMMEFSQPTHQGSSLVSLVELRRRLLERHKTLDRAFRELEDHLEILSSNRPKLHSSGTRMSLDAEARKPNARRRSLKLSEFVEATAFLGLDPVQATYFFSVMDGNHNGVLTIDEFVESLVQMPTKVLLQDFRSRLLTRYGSIPAAFKEIIGGGQADDAGLNRAAFVSVLARLSIVEAEANELFTAIDTDGTGDVSICELREALRDVAPPVTLEGLWHRFLIELPELPDMARACAQGTRADADLCRFAMALSELLPEDLRQSCCFRGAVEAGCILRPLFMLAWETFDAIAANLDVSGSNARTLFAQVQEGTWALRGGRRAEAAQKERHRLTSSKWLQAGSKDVVGEGHKSSTLEGKAGEEAVAAGLADSEVFLEEFAELLLLWLDNPSPPLLPGVLASLGGGRMVHQVTAPAHAAMAALKLELGRRVGDASAAASPAHGGGSAEQQKALQPKPPARRRASKPSMFRWRGGAARSTLTPVFIFAA